MLLSLVPFLSGLSLFLRPWIQLARVGQVLPHLTFALAILDAGVSLSRTFVMPHVHRSPDSSSTWSGERNSSKGRQHHLDQPEKDIIRHVWASIVAIAEELVDLGRAQAVQGAAERFLVLYVLIIIIEEVIGA